MALIEPRLSDPRTGAMPGGVDLSEPPPSPELRDAQVSDTGAEYDSLAMLGDMGAEDGDIGPGSAGSASRIISGVAMALQGINFIAQEAAALVTPVLLQELEMLKQNAPVFIQERQQLGGSPLAGVAMMGQMQNAVGAQGGGAMPPSGPSPMAGPPPAEEDQLQRAF